MTVGLRQEKKKKMLPGSGLKTVSLLSIQNLETYLASGLNLILNLTFDIYTGKKKNPCIVGETEFSKELMKDCPECVENKMFQFEQIF